MRETQEKLDKFVEDNMADAIIYASKPVCAEVDRKAKEYVKRASAEPANEFAEASQ